MKVRGLALTALFAVLACAGCGQGNTTAPAPSTETVTRTQLLDIGQRGLQGCRQNIRSQLVKPGGTFSDEKATTRGDNRWEWDGWVTGQANDGDYALNGRLSWTCTATYSPETQQFNIVAGFRNLNP